MKMAPGVVETERISSHDIPIKLNQKLVDKSIFPDGFKTSGK